MRSAVALFRTDWHADAACAGEDTRVFFAAVPGRARAICSGCPVRAECLHDALTHKAPNGVWGGLTVAERAAIPALPRQKGEAMVLLREHLIAIAPTAHPTDERPDMPMNPTTTTQAAPTAEELPVDELLAWGDQHAGADVQDQAARARAALAGLRTRYAADTEIAAIASEEQQLEQRLAELRMRKGELVPAKAKTKGKHKPLDYPAAEVRAWAKETGRPCPPVGRIPKAVVDAWRADQPGPATDGTP